ncbi:MAG: ABC transporter substrate-binding protein, partial [Planctomycetota bacterium]
MIPAFLMVWLPRLLLGAATALPLQEGPPAAPVVEGEGKYGATPDPFLPYRKSGRAYWRFFDEPTPYRGPGREEPPPQGIDAVKIGLLAPVEKGLDWEIGRSVLRGATLALEEANAAGGFRERLPYELVVRNDSGLWGASSNTLVKLAYEERVWAVLGSVGASTTHVALRVALKAEMPMVTTASTDPTITETAIPWILRCYPDDRQHGYRLARFIFQERGLRRVAMMRSNDKYGRMGVVEFSDAARRVGSPIVVEVRHDLDDEVIIPNLLDKYYDASFGQLEPEILNEINFIVGEL